MPMDEIINRQHKILEKMKELEKSGYHCGGWDEKTNTTALFKGERFFARYAGYITKDAEVVLFPVSYIVIEHDNGYPGSRGYSDMDGSYMLAQYGSITALRTSWDSAGIHIYSISAITL